jgi:hypothetical protein
MCWVYGFAQSLRNEKSITPKTQSTKRATTTKTVLHIPHPRTNRGTLVYVSQGFFVGQLLYYTATIMSCRGFFLKPLHA